mmetsp:Transcript_20895/g.65303  ORF Transcript_20895/g.65303 Transcript_20895/m.65303 type:complete len:232 (+) Transcript_20895:35-730(+)
MRAPLSLRTLSTPAPRSLHAVALPFDLVQQSPWARWCSFHGCGSGCNLRLSRAHPSQTRSPLTCRPARRRPWSTSASAACTPRAWASARGGGSRVGARRTTSPACPRRSPPRRPPAAAPPAKRRLRPARRPWRPPGAGLGRTRGRPRRAAGRGASRSPSPCAARPANGACRRRQPAGPRATPRPGAGSGASAACSGRRRPRVCVIGSECRAPDADTPEVPASPECGDRGRA